jgi:hypothetical protein
MQTDRAKLLAIRAFTLNGERKAQPRFALPEFMLSAICWISTIVSFGATGLFCAS